MLYGSDALTGLVNMIMRHPQIEMTGPVRPTGGGVSVGYGTAARSFSTYNWAQAGGAGFGILGGIGYRSGGDYNTPLGPAVNSDYRSVGGNLNLAYAPVADQRFELTLRSYRETDGRAGGVGGAPGYPFLNVRQSPNDLQMGRLAYAGDFFDGPLKHVEASVYANYFDTHLLTVNTSMPQRIVRQDSHVIGPLVLGGKAFGTFGWDGLPWGALNTTVGIDGWTEARPGATLTTQTQILNGAGNVVSTVNTPQAQTVPDSGQSNVGAFVLNEWTPVQRLTLSAGGRYDWFNTNTELAPLPSPVLLPAYQKASSVDRTAPTGSFGVVYRLLPMLDLLASVQTAFRQPTNAELFNSTATQIPNPNLLPETGLTYEGGFRVNVSNATLKVTVFDSFYKNLILAVPVVFNNSPLHPEPERRRRRDSGRRARGALAGDAVVQHLRQCDSSPRHQYHHQPAAAVHLAAARTQRRPVRAPRLRLFGDGDRGLGFRQDQDRFQAGVSDRRLCGPEPVRNAAAGNADLACPR